MAIRIDEDIPACCVLLRFRARPVDLEWLYDRCLKVSAFGLYLDDEESLAAARRELQRRLEDGSLRLNVSRVLPLEDAAEALGIDTTRYKVTAFVLSAFFAGVAGGLAVKPRRA